MYRRISFVSTVLLSCMAAQLTQAYDMSHVVKAIDDDKSKAGPIVTNCDGLDEGSYAPQLNFTITAIGAHTFRELFHKDLLAKNEIATWYTNTSTMTSAEYTDLRRELGELNTLLANGSYETLTFWKMVEGRVDGSLVTTAQPLDTALDELMGAHFRFPLFTERQDLNVQSRFRALGSFALNRTNPRTGGLGNMPFQCIYYSPAKPEYKPDGTIDPEGFSDSFLIHTVVLAHEMGILPTTELDLRAFAEETYDPNELALLLSSGDECCCNNSTDPDHAIYYRRCDDNFPKGCTEVDGYCAVGSGHCKIIHHHQ